MEELALKVVVASPLQHAAPRQLHTCPPLSIACNPRSPLTPQLGGDGLFLMPTLPTDGDEISAGAGHRRSGGSACPKAQSTVLLIHVPWPHMPALFARCNNPRPALHPPLGTIAGPSSRQRRSRGKGASEGLASEAAGTGAAQHRGGLLLGAGMADEGLEMGVLEGLPRHDMDFMWVGAGEAGTPR